MSFSNLHSRVVRLIEHENSAEITTDALDEIAALAAKQYIKRATEHMPGFDTRLANWQPMRTVRDGEKVTDKPVIDFRERNKRMFGMWEHISGQLATANPDDISILGAEFELLEGQVGHYVSSPQRWRQRAERYLTLLSMLVEVESQAHPTSPGQDQPDPRPNGTYPPNLLIWCGQRHELARLEWRLLDHMWDKDQAEIQAVVEHVWRHGADVTDNALGTTRSRLNRTLTELSPPVPIVISQKQGYIIKG